MTEFFNKENMRQDVIKLKMLIDKDEAKKLNSSKEDMKKIDKGIKEKKKQIQNLKMQIDLLEVEEAVAAAPVGCSNLFCGGQSQSSIHPEWNLYKYLVNPEGRVIKAWSTKVTIDEIFSDVKRAVEEAGKDNTTKFQIKEEVFSEERNRSSDEVLLNAQEDSKIPKPMIVNESVKDEL
ncbi:hypothetical protein QYM36_009558 [Artemia franciscana]|uniref:Uncharacterized protein n=1 Tax=Artemia franciscana TaxID=6661 RepID=A0AA88HZP9_ARTSF|nr:hypothetical protein QYM36_009558 [Artemia franciscana]